MTTVQESKVKVALFAPCYVDAFFPEAGIATLELLERLGCEVAYPLDQTCCGQPMANTGCHADARDTEARFAKNFAGYHHIVTPSANCAHHLRDQMKAIEQTPAVQQVRRNTHGLVAFLHDVLQVFDYPWADSPHKVGLHIGCARGHEARRPRRGVLKVHRGQGSRRLPRQAAMGPCARNATAKANRLPSGSNCASWRRRLRNTRCRTNAAPRGIRAQRHRQRHDRALGARCR